MKILVRRMGALGDVVLTTPVLRKLRLEHPDAEIAVQTGYPTVYYDNPHVNFLLHPATGEVLRRVEDVTVDEINKMGDERIKRYQDHDFDQVINLDMSYENWPDMHIVQAYMLEAFGSVMEGSSDNYQQELFFDRKPLWTKKPKSTVAVHATMAGWTNRTLPRQTWYQVIQLLTDLGMTIILVGTARDNIEGFPGTPRYLTPDLHLQARVIDSVDCFVGSDSGLLHVAGATDTPIVGVFTSVHPRYRLPYRPGLGDSCTAVMPVELDCLGCHGRRPPPVTTEACERGDNACVGMVKADDIVEAVRNMVGI